MRAEGYDGSERPKREGPLSIWCGDQEEDQEVWKEAKGKISTAIFYLTATQF